MLALHRRRTRVLPDPSDSRYPRRFPLVLLRRLLLHGWGILAFYSGNALWNLYLLFRDLPPHLDYTVLFKEVVAALVLPFPLNSPNTPLWVYGICILLLMILVFGNIWARRDAEQEEEVEVARKVNDAVTGNLQNMGPSVPLPLPLPYSPPFDVALLPLAEPFIGRTADAQRLLKRLRAPRTGRIGNIAALRGMAGIGKTALAGKVVRDLRDAGVFRDGIAVYLCQGCTNPTGILQEVLARFDPQRRLPSPSDIGETIRQLLEGKDALVVLDNVELNLALGPIVTPLRHSGVSVLITSQYSFPQDIAPGDASYRLEQLHPNEAMELFERVRGSPLAAPKREAAERILRILGYHTLAVKIAGAYARHRDLETLAHELEEDPLLATGLPEGETPHAVEAVFNNSIKQLPPNAQQFFVALAAFTTPEFSRRAAMQLAKDLGLSRLREVNPVELLVGRLLIDISSNDTLSVQRDRERLRLHPLLYALASSKFTRLNMKRQEDASLSVAKYYAQYTLKAEDEVLVADEQNISGSLKWAQAYQHNELVVTLCTNMRNFWFNRWRMDTCQQYLPWGVKAAEEIAQSTNKRTDRLNAATLELTYGRVLQRLGKIDDAEITLKKSLQIRLEVQDPGGESEVLASLGQIAQQRGRRREAEEYYEQSLKLFRQLKNGRGEGMILGYMGELAWRRGRLEDAQTYCQQALDMLRQVQDQYHQAQVLIRLGEIAHDRGFVRKAADYFREALTIARGSQDRYSEGCAYRGLGDLAVQRQPVEAVDYYQRALIISYEMRDKRSESWIQGKFGEIAQGRDDPDEARSYYQRALEIAREVKDRRAESWALGKLGRLAQEGNKLEEAEQYYKEALEIARDMEDLIYYARLAFLFGSFLVEQQNNQQDGCRLLRDAVSLYSGMGLPGQEEVRRLARRYQCTRV